jgi:hypothetical protein
MTRQYIPDAAPPYTAHCASHAGNCAAFAGHLVLCHTPSATQQLHYQPLLGDYCVWSGRCQASACDSGINRGTAFFGGSFREVALLHSVACGAIPSAECSLELSSCWESESVNLEMPWPRHGNVCRWRPLPQTTEDISVRRLEAV